MANSYENIIIPELPLEERSHPYAPFYDHPIKPPAAHILKALRPESRKDPSWGIPAAEFERTLLAQGVEDGWCLLPDGTGFSAVTVDMPGLTEEMLEFWSYWHRMDDTTYKIWFPGFHVSHFDHMLEDLGWGVLRAELVSFIDLKSLPLSAPPEVLDPSFYSNETVSGNMFVPDDPTVVPFASTLSHQLTRTATGFKMLLAAWTGVHIIDGKPVRAIGGAMDPEQVRLFAMHNAYEFTRMADMLPSLFEFTKHNGLQLK